eukprot:274023-Rhodomonas_salina.1
MLSAYALAVRCPVLTPRMLLSAYARAKHFRLLPVLPNGHCAIAWQVAPYLTYPIPGNDIGRQLVNPIAMRYLVLTYHSTRVCPLNAYRKRGMNSCTGTKNGMILPGISATAQAKSWPDNVYQDLVFLPLISAAGTSIGYAGAKSSLFMPGTDIGHAEPFPVRLYGKLCQTRSVRILTRLQARVRDVCYEPVLRERMVLPDNALCDTQRAYGPT